MAEKTRKKRVLRESFLPAAFIMALLFLAVFFVEMKVRMDADKVIVVEIESSTVSPSSILTEDSDWELKAVQFAASGPVAGTPGTAPVSAGHEAQFEEKAVQSFEAQAAALYKSGKLEQALSALERAIKSGNAGSSSYFERAGILANLGRYEDAARDYRTALKHNPHHFEANYNLGLVLMRLKDLHGAAQAFKAASESTGGPRKANALYKMGAVYMRLGSDKYALARDAFEQAIRVQPDNIPARLKLAEMEPETPEGYEKGMETFERALKVKPNYAPVYLSMAVFQSSRGKVTQAITSYSNAIKFNPELLETRHKLGVLLLSERRWSEARDQFGLAVKKDPDNASSRFYLGRAAFGQKDYKGALEEFRKAVSLRGGDYPEAYMNMGRAHSAMGDMPMAIQAYQDALKLRPDYHEAWYNMGLVYLRQKKMDDAIKSFKTAVEHSPSFLNAWFNLGVAYARAGEEASSIKAYKRALLINPDHKQAMLNLAVRYAKGGQFQDAIRLYKDVLVQDESYSSAWLNLGIAYFKSGDNLSAGEALERAMELEPNELKARFYASQVKIALRDYAGGVQMMEQVVDMDPTNPEWRRELAAALRKAGRAEEADRVMKKAHMLGVDKERKIDEAEVY